MYKLRTKITFSYFLISLVIVILIGILANVMVETTFRNYIIKTQQQNTDKIIQQLIARYNSFIGGWSYDVLDNIGMNALGNNLIIKIKVDNNYIWDAWTHNNGLCMMTLQNITNNMKSRYPNIDGEYIEKALDIVIEEKVVATVDIGYYGPFHLTDNDLYFINRLNSMLIIVVIFSLGIAILIGSYISLRLTTPISKVINAASEISKGKFTERIVITSKTKEINSLIYTVNNMAEKLETVEKLRKRLTADVAHELRTPLSTLQSHMEAMIDGIWKADKERLESCHDEIMRLNRMVGDLKKLSEFEGENLTLNKQIFNLGELIERIVLNFEAESQKKEIKIVVNNEYVGEINGDRDKISQIIVNIISNAIRYSNKYGTVYICTKENLADTVDITIKDYGIGMCESDLPFIFERFYRSDKSRTKATGGIGIGLAIVKSLVVAHNGEITVQSNLGEGSTFKVSLPYNFIKNH